MRPFPQCLVLRCLKDEMKRRGQIKLMKINRKSISSWYSSIRFRQRAAKLSLFRAKNSGSTGAAVCPSSTTSYITARVLASRVTVYTLSPSPCAATEMPEEVTHHMALGTLLASTHKGTYEYLPIRLATAIATAMTMTTANRAPMTMPAI